MINETFEIGQLQEAAMSYFSDDSLASSVWINKYALKSPGTSEKYLELSPADTINRLINEISRKELEYPNPLSKEEIAFNLENFKNFIFGGSIIFGLGNNQQVSSLGNCFFIDNNADSYGAIFNIDETVAQLMKRRGGVGISIENLRPTSSTVNNSAKSSTGSVSFMDRFSNTTREVAQDGRRGALMISCFAPDTFVKTDKGWECITNVIKRWYNGDNPHAWTHEGFKEITNVQELPVTPIYEVQCENGKKIKVTGDHKFLVKNSITNEEYLKPLIDIDVEIEHMVFFGVHNDDIYSTVSTTI